MQKINDMVTLKVSKIHQDTTKLIDPDVASVVHTSMVNDTIYTFSIFFQCEIVYREILND